MGDEGEDMSHSQQLLSGTNRVGYDADPGPVTGVFTEATGAAVQRMKFHLGYPTRDRSPGVGSGSAASWWTRRLPPSPDCRRDTG